MEVCRHWQELIINTRTIWCALNLRKHTRWTELCLARAATTPISADVGVKNRYDLHNLNTVYPHVHHLRSLVFKVVCPTEDTERRDIVAALEVLFRNGMPILEELDFYYEWNHRYQFPIDLELTSKQLPRLQCLTLTRVVAPRDPSLYMQLRALASGNCTWKTLSIASQATGCVRSGTRWPLVGGR